MRLLQQLKTVPLFIEYFLKVVDAHSMQAPFAFQFYNDLRNGIRQATPFGDIEQARNRYKRDNSLVMESDLGAGSRIDSSKKISSIARYGISAAKECIFLHELANICKPKVCIELGTSLGIATAYLAKSNYVESIYTFEGNRELVEKSNQLFKDLNSEKATIIHGNIDEELPGKLAQLDQIDLAIVDANHTEKALMRYVDLLKTKMSSDGVMVIDDIRWSIEMNRAWKKLIKYHEFSVSMEFMNNGLLFLKKGLPKQRYILAL